MRYVQLDEVADINPRKNSALSPDDYCSFIPMEYVDDELGAVMKTDPRQIHEVEKGYTAFNNNDVLFAKITPCMENGKCAIARELINGIGFGSTEFHVIRAKDQIMPEWIFYYLRREELRKDAEVNMTGSAGQKRVSTRYMQEIEILLPPLDEQRRIAAILEEADHARRTRRYAQSVSDTFLQSVFVEMFGDPVTNPMGWNIVNLDRVCTKITDGTHQPPKFTNEGIPFIFISNIVNGYIDFNETNFVSNETYEYLTRSTKVEKRDILYSSVGVSLGRAVEVLTDRQFTFQRHIAHIKPDHNLIDATFLCNQLNTDFVYSQAQMLQRGAAQPTINLREIRSLEIIYPPTDIQNEFSELVSIQNETIAQKNEAERQSEHLFQTLLDRAFRGEL